MLPGASIYRKLMNLPLSLICKMLGKDIYCEEEGVFGKGSWDAMGRGLEMTSSRETGPVFSSVLGFL